MNSTRCVNSPDDGSKGKFKSEAAGSILEDVLGDDLTSTDSFVSRSLGADVDDVSVLLWNQHANGVIQGGFDGAEGFHGHSFRAGCVQVKKVLQRILVAKLLFGECEVTGL